MSLVRLLKTAQVTLTHEFRVDETLTDAAGAVTATVKRLDGTAISGSPFTAAHPGLGTYTFALPGQASLDELTVDWSGSVAGATVVVRDYVEVVGGFLFGLAEARAAHPGFISTSTYQPSLLAAARIEVEQECEAICRQAFVPRFARLTLSGNDTPRLGTPLSMLRTVRAVSVGGVAWSAPDTAAVGVSDHGVLTRPGGAIWPSGASNVVVELEHGWDFPPEEIRQAAILRLRSRIAATTSGVPDRAVSFSVQAGGVYRLSTPSRQRTGIPGVDGPYERYTRLPRAVFA